MAPDAPLFSFELNGVTVTQSGGDFVGDSGDINLEWKNISNSVKFYLIRDTSCEEVKAKKDEAVDLNSDGYIKLRGIGENKPYPLLQL